LTIFPCIVCDYIGEQEFFKTYSLIFALFLINASVIILVSGFLKESFGANTAMWLNSLFFSGALPLAGGVIMLLLKKSKRRAPEQDRELPNDVISDEIKPDETSNDGLTDENKEISREEDEAIQQNN